MWILGEQEGKKFIFFMFFFQLTWSFSSFISIINWGNLKFSILYHVFNVCKFLCIKSCVMKIEGGRKNEAKSRKSSSEDFLVYILRRIEFLHPCEFLFLVSKSYKNENSSRRRWKFGRKKWKKSFSVYV